jgi:hypothetical protein
MMPQGNPTTSDINLNVTGRVELNVPEPKGSEKERPSNERYRDSLKTDFFKQLCKVRFLVEVLTLVLLGVYTAINYCLYRTTKDTEQVSERAYVNVKSIIFVPLVVGQPMDAVVTYKTPGTLQPRSCMSLRYLT